MIKDAIKVTANFGLANTCLATLQALEETLDAALEPLGYGRTVSTKGGATAEFNYEQQGKPL